MTDERRTTGNSTYKKLAVQWLNETLCLVSSSVLADSFVLRNRQLLVAAKRYWQQNIDTRGLFQDTFFAWLFFLLHVDMYQFYFRVYCNIVTPNHAV
jgi:hypothetical protein